MSISREEILNIYAPFNRPIPYKDWEIYPIMVQDTFMWEKYFPLLDIDKNSLNNIDIIQMSYLKFLIYASLADDEDENLNIIEGIKWILYKCLNLSNRQGISVNLLENSDVELWIGDMRINNQNEPIMDYATKRVISSKDFEKIRKIILYQNLIDYDDKYIDPDIKKSTEEFYRLKNKHVPHISLERKKICIQSCTGMSTEEINKMTYREFQMLFDVSVEKIDYHIYKMAEINGAKFNEKIEHWAYKQSKDKYKEAFTNLNSFEDKINSANI